MKSEENSSVAGDDGSGIPSMTVEEALQRASEIEICIRKLSEDLGLGRHISGFSGTGSDFSEIREYIFGDDIRAFDWNSTARFCEPMVRVFTEEHDMAVYLLVDRSASGTFGNNVSKEERIFEISASLLLSAMISGDSAGLCLFTGEPEVFIPAKKGRKHTLHMLNEMIRYKPESRGTDLKRSISYLCNTIKRRSLIVILSDFDSPEFTDELLLLSRKHDVRAVRISDRSELIIPDAGYFLLRDPETFDEILVNTSDEKFRESYSRIISSCEKKLDSVFTSAGIRALQVYTDEDFLLSLRSYMGISVKEAR